MNSKHKLQYFSQLCFMALIIFEKPITECLIWNEGQKLFQKK